MCKKGEDVDFFGILIHGEVFASVEHSKFCYYKIGEMFGYMNLSELSTSTKHKFDVIA